jgi:hypothetical protein
VALHSVRKWLWRLLAFCPNLENVIRQVGLIGAACLLVGLQCWSQQQDSTSRFWVAVATGASISPRAAAVRQKVAAGVALKLTSRLDFGALAWGALKETSVHTTGAKGLKLLLKVEAPTWKGWSCALGEGMELQSAVHPVSWLNQVSLSHELPLRIRGTAEYEASAGNSFAQSIKAIFSWPIATHVSLTPFYEWHYDGARSDSRVYFAVTYSTPMRRSRTQNDR